MPCEQYRKALIELAATAAEPRGDLGSHLHACPACRTSLEQEQLLFASIDSNLRSSMNEQVPDSFLLCFRARLDAESMPKRSWQMWAAAAVTAAIVITLLIAQGTTQRGKQAAHDQPAPQAPTAIVAESRLVSSPPSTTRKQRLPRHIPLSQGTLTTPVGQRTTPRRAKFVEPEILVSAEDQQATTRYLDSLLRYRVPRVDAQEDSAALEIVPITIAELEVTTLEKTSEKGTDK